jgi:tetratricopeptide (TPR) repeat protein
MSQADLSQAPLTDPSEREWELLSNTIDFANQFWIVFLFPNDRYPANIILHRIRRIEQDPPLHLVELTFDQPEDLREFLPRVLAAAPDALLWCAAMAHETPEWRRAWVYYSQRWNEHREVLRRARTGGLLLVASPWVKPLMQSMAPDLWSIRTLALDPTAPPVATSDAPQPLQPLSVNLEPKTLSPQPPVSDARRALALQQAQRALSQPNDPPLPAFLRLGASLQPLLDAQAWDTLRQVAPRAHAAYRQWTTQPPPQNPNAEAAAYLIYLGIAWRELGHREEALEATLDATQKYRKLVKDRPDAFLPDLAMSLNNLGLVLSELGRREEALEATQEAARRYHELAKDRPDAFLPYLAAILNNLGKILYELGRKEDALKINKEALQAYGQLAKDSPDAFLSKFAGGINNFGVMLYSLGKREEALDATSEAAKIRRQLAEDRPDAFLSDLAASLNNLGVILSELGRREEALEAAREAVAIYTPLVQERPGALGQDLVRGLRNLSERLRELGLDPGSDSVFAEGERVRLSLNLGEGSE